MNDDVIEGAEALIHVYNIFFEQRHVLKADGFDNLLAMLHLYAG